MKFPIGAMTVGDVLDRGIKLLLARLPAYYLIDLIVAWPFALIVQGLLAPLSLRASVRWITAAFGLMLTLSWNAALRYTNLFFGLRAFPWLAIAFTLLASEAVRRSLFKHVDRQSKGETETQSPRLDVAMVESVG